MFLTSLTSEFVVGCVERSGNLAEQIRIVITTDAATKEIIESAAAEFAGGTASAYLRGLSLLHELLLGRGTGHADIPGWLYGNYPLDLIAELSETIKEAKKRKPVMPTRALSLHTLPSNRTRKPAKK